MYYTIEEIISSLKKKLDEDRFTHSMNVAACARDLAKRYICNEDKAYLAGILHDCAKQYGESDMLLLAEEAGFKLRKEEIEAPVSLLHAELSAYVAARDYKIEDTEVLQAIAYHSSGGIGLTRLDKILGLSDAIEPLRTGSDADRLRKLAEIDLNEAYIEKHILYMVNTIKSKQYLPEIKWKVYQLLLEELKVNNVMRLL